MILHIYHMCTCHLQPECVMKHEYGWPIWLIWTRTPSSYMTNMTDMQRIRTPLFICKIIYIYIYEHKIRNLRSGLPATGLRMLQYAAYAWLTCMSDMTNMWYFCEYCAYCTYYAYPTFWYIIDVFKGACCEAPRWWGCSWDERFGHFTFFREILP